MIYLKTHEEIELLRENNLLVSATLAELAKHIKPGVTTSRLDKIAEDFIRSHGLFPFSRIQRFSEHALHVGQRTGCTRIPSSKTVLKEGDILSVDCGTFMKGFCGDSAYTFAVGEIAPEAESLLRVTKEALYKGVAQAKPGNRVGDVGNAVQEHAEKHGYSVVRRWWDTASAAKCTKIPRYPITEPEAGGRC